jgi:hypothetical protein
MDYGLAPQQTGARCMHLYLKVPISQLWCSRMQMLLVTIVTIHSFIIRDNIFSIVDVYDCIGLVEVPTEAKSNSGKCDRRPFNEDEEGNHKPSSIHVKGGLGTWLEPPKDDDDELHSYALNLFD